MTPELALLNTGVQQAKQRISAFRQRFGDGHFYLACHAALPIVLTPDLLYRLWASFQQDTKGHILDVPWIAVSDLLLSNLYENVGYELYEMDIIIQNELLSQLQKNDRFGPQRVREIANFVIAYVEHELEHSDIDTRNLAQTQKLRALAYKEPHEAAYDIALMLTQLSFNDKTEWLRIATLLNSLSKPLAVVQPLLDYIRAMSDFARGNLESATAQMNYAVDADRQVRVEGINLPIPDVLNTKLPQKAEPDTSPKSRNNSQLTLVIAGGAIGLLLITIGIQYGLRSSNPSQTPDLVSSTTPSPKSSISIPPSIKPTSSPTISPSPPNPFPSITPSIGSPSASPQSNPTISFPIQATLLPSTSAPISFPSTEPSTGSSTIFTPPSPSIPTPIVVTPLQFPKIVPQESPKFSKPIERTEKQSIEPLSPINQEIMQEVLMAHNQCRSRVNVAPLQWSTQLASTAQDWADNMPKNEQLTHRSGGGGFGENIAAGSMSPASLVAMWCDEKPNYDEQSGKCQGGVCGHFTQVVWSRTNTVGCGISSHPNYGKVLICNYDPPGNFNGEKAY